MEYAGFEAASPIDWAKLTSGLTSTIQDIGEKRRLEREELDKLKTDNEKIISDTELTKSQTFNEMLLGGANNGKENLVLWNKQLKAGIIKPTEYRNRVNNLMSNWSTLANTAKEFDKQMEETIKLQQEGKGSGFSLYTNGLIAEMGDFKSKKIQVDQNTGNVLIGKLNNEGVFDPNSIVDIRTLSQPGNMIDYKVNVSEAVDVGTKGIQSWVLEKGITTTTDPRQNPFVKQAVFDLAKSIASNPRAIASILSDNTSKKYDFYSDEDELKRKLEERANYRDEFLRSDGKSIMSASERKAYIEEQKDLLIPVVLDANGTFQPNPTQKQQDDALNTVITTIESRLERKVTEDEPQRPIGGGSGRGSGSDRGSNKAENFEVAAYVASNKALDKGDFASLDNEKYNFKQGVDSRGKKYVLVQSRAYSQRDGIYFDNPNAKKIKIYSAEGLSQYIKGMDKQKNLSISIYNSGKDDYFKLNKTTLPGTYSVKNDSSNRRASEVATPPKKGDVVDGYIFLGGDPSNQNNWKKK